jgi:2,3-bisphosphoglycerate-dependent phosphoglycerate mutase
MKTTLVFIRHAEPDFSVKDDLSRPLSAKGECDANELINRIGIRFDFFFSSPARRAIDTIAPLAGIHNKEITIVNDLREREIGTWVENFREYARRQWEDFHYRLKSGESLGQAQERTLAALAEIRRQCEGKEIAIGTHGTALGLILNGFDPSFGFPEILSILDRMPLLVEMAFDHDTMIHYKIVD